jgi:diguanylate cyclase (GGDEF)-like protein
MTKIRPGGVTGPEVIEILYEIGQRAAGAEGISEIAAFAVEQTGRLVRATHVALLQVEGESLLPIATCGWPGFLEADLEGDVVLVSEQQASEEGVNPVSRFTADVMVQGRRWAVLTVHQASGARSPGDAAVRLGAVANLLGSTRSLEVANHRLAYLATHDPLTGLPNRQQFLERLKEAQAVPAGAGSVRAVICLDMDRFFQVNEAVGYAAADALIQDVAARLRRSAGSGDVAARQIGDRFLVLADGLPSEAAARAEAERLRRSITGAVRVGTRDVVVTSSAGVVLADPETPVEDLLWEAESAMFDAKSEGRNRVAVFAPSFHDRITMRRHLEIDLRDALDQDGLVLHYQPIVDLTDHRMIGAEALIRWSHPDRGLMPPADFLAVADESRLVSALTEWVLNTACSSARQWQDVADAVGLKAPGVAVNVSAHELAEAGLVHRVSAALDHCHLSPEMLTLEVSESVAMSESDRLALAAQKLHEMGVALSIDDCGTGYLALGHLRRLRVDGVKIDRPYVQGLGRDPDDEVIVGGILAMARALGIDAVAEGVETLAQAEELERLGCRLAQGYLFGRPAPRDAISSYISRGSRPQRTVVLPD